MKNTLVLISLIMSTSSFALVCESEDNPGKKLQFSHVSYKVVTGELISKTVEQVYVGTSEINSSFNGKTYTLYNQNGKLSKLVTHKSGGDIACRARVCPSYPSIIKAKLSSEDQIDEYFTCL